MELQGPTRCNMSTEPQRHLCCVSILCRLPAEHSQGPLQRECATAERAMPAVGHAVVRGMWCACGSDVACLLFGPFTTNTWQHRAEAQRLANTMKHRVGHGGDCRKLDLDAFGRIFGRRCVVSARV